jgi:hypothetical protein
MESPPSSEPAAEGDWNSLASNAELEGDECREDCDSGSCSEEDDMTMRRGLLELAAELLCAVLVAL